MIARLLSRFASWALSKNPPGGYGGEDDGRWAYIIETDDDPYLTRILFSRLPVLKNICDALDIGVYLHRFHRPDSDRNMHDHPWAWAYSLILAGSYDEERVDEIVYVPTGRAGDWHGFDRVVLTIKRHVRWFNSLRATDFHAVTKLHGDVWTLFVTGPRVQDWGFLVDGEKVPWRTYLRVDEELAEAHNRVKETMQQGWAALDAKVCEFRKETP